MCQALYRCQNIIRSSILCFNHILPFPHKPIKSRWASVSWVSVTYNQKSPDEDTMMSREEKKTLRVYQKIPFDQLRKYGSVTAPEAERKWQCPPSLDVPSPALNFRSLPIYAIITLG